MSNNKNYTIDTDKIIPFIVGPTAVGKTAVSIELGKQLNGEIISVDSRQIYKKLNIGTAKPDPEEMKQVEHHLVGIVEPDKRISAGKYRELALKKVNQILAKGKLPIFVGGSGMYIRSVTRGFFKGSRTDQEIRAEIKKELKIKGRKALYQRLQKIDPEYAKKIHFNDTKRITRALEIYRINDKPPTELYNEQKNSPPFPHIILGLKRKRKKLYQRINQRVDEMIKAGLIDEVVSLRQEGYGKTFNRIKTVGYYEINRYLDGEISKEEAIELIKQNTRNYAKRQMSWFRNQTETTWISIEDKTKEEIVNEITQIYRKADAN